MNSHRAVILGATSSLAQSVVLELIAQDANYEIILVARNSVNLSIVANDLIARGATVGQYVCDLDDVTGHDRLLEKICVADSYWIFYGTLPNQSIAESDWAATDAALQTNFLSPVSLLTRIANILEARKQGSIVVVTSVAGDRGRKSNYVYGTAKGALSLFTQGLRNRLSSSSVHLMTVKPGFIDTAMTADIEKQPAILWASSERIAKEMVSAFQKKKDVLYTPWFWRYILIIIKTIPESIFKKLSL